MELFLWLLARYSPEKLFWFLPKAVYLVTLPLIPASPLRILSNLCLWNPESCALESGIQIKEYGMPLKIWIRNPNSSCKLRNPVRNPESKTVLDSLTWGKAIKRAIPISIALWDKVSVVSYCSMDRVDSNWNSSFFSYCWFSLPRRQK